MQHVLNCSAQGRLAQDQGITSERSYKDSYLNESIGIRSCKRTPLAAS